ncbi:MAG: HlyD family secretion protein [Defluviitaleaceae bacterium]|nr:HlyD family secretion protein [Defluviitaleaceae bacterium]
MNKKIRAILVALAILLVLIFMSGTMHNFNMPTVTAALPTRGYLNHREVTSGIVRYAETAELYAETSGWVYRILAGEGESVTQGQPIIVLDFRTNTADVQAQIQSAHMQFQRQINALQIDRATNQVEIERINAEIANIQRQITAQQSETFTPIAISNFQLQAIAEEITQAEHFLYQTNTLLTAGIVTRQALVDAENALSALLANQAQLYSQYQLQNEDEHIRQQDWERQQENRILDLTHQLESQHIAIRTLNIQAQNFALREETLHAEWENNISHYERRLINYESTTIVSPVDGVITNLPINQGQHISANGWLASIGLTAQFIVECEIPLSNHFITTGSTAMLRNALGHLEGVVTQVIPLDHAKSVTIAIDTSIRAVTAGETFTITFEEPSANTAVLVPNTAIGRDGDGYFISQVRQRRGVLGNEFYTRQTRVIIGDSDDQNTSIIQGITFFEPIVVISDKPFSEGQSIRLGNEGDFFEN